MHHPREALLPGAGLAADEDRAVGGGGEADLRFWRHPVIVGAAVEAFLDPSLRSELAQATSGAPFPVVVVNGPIARQIRLNSGFGCLGPDPQYPAGSDGLTAIEIVRTLFQLGSELQDSHKGG